MDFKKDIYQDPEIKKYLKQMTQDQRAFVSLANILFTRGFLDEAIDVCKDGLEKNPNFAAGRAVLGKCFHKSGNKENARVEFENTLKINPENVVALKGLGEIYYGLQIYDKSLDMYKRLLFIDPMNEEFKTMIEKTTKALDTQEKLREERLERLKQQNGSEAVNDNGTAVQEQTTSTEELLPEQDTVTEHTQEDETYQTSFPRTEQPVEEIPVAHESFETSTVTTQSQQFSQADIDQLIGASVTPSLRTDTPVFESESLGSERGILSKIETVTSTLIELYRLAGLHEDAEYLQSRLSGTADIPMIPSDSIGTAVTADLSPLQDTVGITTADSATIQDSLLANSETLPVMQDSITDDILTSETTTVDTSMVTDMSSALNEMPHNELQDEVMPNSSSELDDILGTTTSSMDIDDLLNKVVPQQAIKTDIVEQKPAHIITEDVLNKEDVSAFEITGSENIRWRQGEDADIEKTIESSDGIFANDSAAMQMFTQEVNESAMPQVDETTDLGIPESSFTAPTDSFIDEIANSQPSNDALHVTEESFDSIQSDANLSGLPDTIEDTVSEEVGAVSEPSLLSVPENTTINDTITSLDEIEETLSFDDAAAVSIPASSQNDPFSLDSALPSTEEVIENSIAPAVSEEAVEELLDSDTITDTEIPESIPESITEDVLTSSQISEESVDTHEELTTDENFVPEYRQDAFYSIEDAAQSLTDLQSLMAATEENFTEPPIGETMPVVESNSATMSSDDIMDELSDDEAMSKERAASMDFTGASDVMITPNQSEEISQTELQKFASREELDMTDMLTEQNSIPQETSHFEGKNELEMEEIHITATSHTQPSDEKTIIQEEIEETIDSDTDTTTSFSGKNEVSLGDVSLTSKGAPQQQKELNPDTLLLPGMEQKKDSVNIDEFLNDTEKKDDMDDINNWLKGL